MPECSAHFSEAKDSLLLDGRWRKMICLPNASNSLELNIKDNSPADATALQDDSLVAAV